MRPHLPKSLARALARFRHPRMEHLPLIGGPADGIVLLVPRPAPPWVFASLRPMADGTVLLATASDAMGVYVSLRSEQEGIACYRRVGTRYVHVREDRSIDDEQVPSPRST
jgi:hypothetical protein